MLFGDFFKDSIVVDAARHPAMEELAKELHGPVAMALHALHRPGRSGWRWPASSLAWFLYLKRPDIPAAIKRRFGFIYRLLENKYYFDWFNEHVLSRAARPARHGLWKARRRRHHRRHPHRRQRQRRSAACGQSTRRAAERLSLLVRAGDDRRRHRPDDLAALALPRQPDRPLAGQNNKNMPLLSIAIWLPILSGVLLLAFGRDDRAERGALGRAGRLAGELPGHDSAGHRLRHGHRGDAVHRAPAAGSSASTSGTSLGVDGLSVWFVPAHGLHHRDRRRSRRGR